MRSLLLCDLRFPFASIPLFSAELLLRTISFDACNLLFLLSPNPKQKRNRREKENYSRIFIDEKKKSGRYVSVSELIGLAYRKAHKSPLGEGPV
ncbi:hypothetical protein SLA2020_194610 [Shorea laevis]